MANHGYLSRLALGEMYGLDTLAGFRDVLHLSQLTRQVIKEQIQREAQLFFWVDHLEMYRNWEREDVIAIPRENPLITYMVLENRLISTREIRVKALCDEAPELKLFFDSERISYLIPVVFHYTLLGFVALMGDYGLSSEERQFCRYLKDHLRQYVYTGLLMERRLQEMLGLNYFTKELSLCVTPEEVYQRFFELVRPLLPVSAGVFYRYDEFRSMLVPVSRYGVEDVKELSKNEGISGFVLEKQKPLLVNDVIHQPFLVERQKEEGFLRGAVLILPLIQDEKRWGVIAFARYNGEYGVFSSDHLYLGRILAQIVVTVLASKVYYERLEHNYFDTIRALTTALEAKDSYTRGHSERVLEYVTWIAEEMELSKTTLRNLQFAAVLHDIGKIGIDEYIIRKNGKLTEEEFDQIKHHPEIGDHILASVDFLKEAREYVHYHHEKLDGSGYYGKHVGEFPWETTIVVLADMFDALTSDRPYRKALAYDEALVLLKEEIGITFDQRVYQALVQALKKRHLLPKDVAVS
ncbi:MAG: GAF domain-containing protein [Brevinematales bacterium]|nr:GAF domain-containing protein [Brevinematales bacterium]